MPLRNTRDSTIRSFFATLATITILLAAFPTGAQDRSPLIRALRHGDFRVRIQAAFAIGSTGDRNLRPYLERTLLRDRSPAVRAAAATGLGRLGAPESIATLRTAMRDESQAVRAQAARSIALIRVPSQGATATVGTAPRPPDTVFPAVTVIPTDDHIAWPRVRYVVVVGDVHDQSNFRRAALTDHLRGELTHQLRLVRNIALFQGTHAVDNRAQQEIRRRRLPQLRVDANLAKVESRLDAGDLAVRCEVSLMVLDEPGRNLRGMLRGAATGTAPRQRRTDQVDQLARQAVSAAVRSAMSRADVALTAAAEH